MNSPLLTKAEERRCEECLAELRRVRPHLQMLAALGRADADLELRVRQLEESFQAALDLNQRAIRGELE